MFRLIEKQLVDILQLGNPHKQSRESKRLEHSGCARDNWLMILTAWWETASFNWRDPYAQTGLFNWRDLPAAMDLAQVGMFTNTALTRIKPRVRR